MLNILLVDDEPDLLLALAQLLKSDGHHIETAADGEAAIAHLSVHPFHLVMTDVRLPKLDGMALLRRIRRDFPATEVLLMTAFGSIGDAVLAMKDSAVDYVTKPFDLDRLAALVEKIDERTRVNEALERAHAAAAGEYAGARLKGRSLAIRQVIARIEIIADSEAPVLIVGESGTGKELVARILCELSRRRSAPLVFFDCEAIPPPLVEAELFGHERGAFLGAIKRREGRFEAADGGTLFLDAIGALPLEAQAKLLRVLDDGEIVPVGAKAPVEVDVRLIAATSQDLPALIARGRWRQDLYGRIKVFELYLPPLRERLEDLPLLIAHFLCELDRNGSGLPKLSPDAWKALHAYPFPGNVRELRHVIQHASILARGGDIELAHLPPEVRDAAREAYGHDGGP